MFKLIEKLRNKPEKKKQRIVLSVALSVTLVIAAFWSVALVIKIQRGDLSFTLSDSEASRIKGSVDSVGDSWDSFLESVSNIAEPVQETVIPTEEDVVATTSDDIGDNVE